MAPLFMAFGSLGVQSAEPVRIPGAGVVPEHHLSLSSPDETLVVMSDSRIALDAAVYDEDRQPMGNGADLTSGRLGLKARI